MNLSETPETARETANAPRRKDALRNRERVVAAAFEVFREYGTEGSVPQIASKAQVGKATVYRSFPTKEDLLEAITRLSLDELERRTAAALRADDPYDALHRFVGELFDTLARDRLLAERLADSGSPAAAAILETLGGLLETARAAGKLREDATRLDLRVFLCGTALQLMRLEERDPTTWRRYGDMTLRALQRLPQPVTLAGFAASAGARRGGGGLLRRGEERGQLKSSVDAMSIRCSRRGAEVCAISGKCRMTEVHTGCGHLKRMIRWMVYSTV